MRAVKTAFAALLVLAALAPAASLAATASTEGYSTVNGRVEQQVAPVAGPSGSKAIPAASQRPTQATAASLPFTGIDLALVAAAGLMLGGLGLTLRRLARD